MYQCTGQCQLLFHSSGELAGQPVLERLDLAINILDQVIILFYCGVEQCCEKLEVLLHSEVFVQGKLARHISDDISYRHIVLVSVESFN